MHSDVKVVVRNVGYIMATALCGVATFGFHFQWQNLEDKAIVPGMGQSFTRTVDIILESKDKRYLLFRPEDVDTALSGARLRSSAGLTAQMIRITGDSMNIHRHHSRFHSDDYPGLSVEVSGEVSGVDNRPAGRDTIWLELPGAQRLADALGDTPLRVREYPEPIDQSFLDVFTHYPSLAAVKRARTPWHVAWIVSALLSVVVGVRALVRVRPG